MRAHFNLSLTGFNLALTATCLLTCHICITNYFSSQKSIVMKTATNVTRVFALALLIFAMEFGFAQQTTTDKPQQQKYCIKIVKDENGKQEVISKTFASKDEMDAYMKENKMDAPEMAELPGAASTATGSTADTKTKKVIISETDESAAGGKTSLDITYENFTAEERAQFIQTILNQKAPM